jgi:hypothetical protein
LLIGEVTHAGISKLMVSERFSSVKSTILVCPKVKTSLERKSNTMQLHKDHEELRKVSQRNVLMD